MFALDFKARVDPSLPCFIACVQWIPHIHLWCDTSWPARQLNIAHEKTNIGLIWTWDPVCSIVCALTQWTRAGSALSNIFSCRKVRLLLMIVCSFATSNVVDIVHRWTCQRQYQLAVFQCQGQDVCLQNFVIFKRLLDLTVLMNLPSKNNTTTM